MKKRIRQTALACGLPEDALALGARVTLVGRGSVLVEGQHGVVELEKTSIRLRTCDGILCIQGSALRLKELSSDSAMIVGERIDTASYGKPELR